MVRGYPIVNDKIEVEWTAAGGSYLMGAITSTRKIYSYILLKSLCKANLFGRTVKQNLEDVFTKTH